MVGMRECVSNTIFIWIYIYKDHINVRYAIQKYRNPPCNTHPTSIVARNMVNIVNITKKHEKKRTCCYSEPELQYKTDYGSQVLLQVFVTFVAVSATFKQDVKQNVRSGATTFSGGSLFSAFYGFEIGHVHIFRGLAEKFNMLHCCHGATLVVFEK